MTPNDIFFVITLAVQFFIVRQLCAKIWFPQIPPVPAAVGQGFIAFCVAALAGGVLSALLWFSLIAYPVLYTWLAVSDAVVSAETMRDTLWMTWLIAISPYLYMLIRLFEQIRQRRAMQAWQSGQNDDRLR